MLRLTRAHFAALAIAIVWPAGTQGAASPRVGPIKASIVPFAATPLPTRTPQQLATRPRIVYAGTVVTFFLTPSDGETSVPIAFGDGASGTLQPASGAPALEAKHAYGTANLRGYVACLNRPTLPVIVAPDLCTRVVVQSPAATPTPSPSPSPSPLPATATLGAKPNGVPAGTVVTFSFGPISARVRALTIAFDDGTTGSLTGVATNAALNTLTTTHAFAAGRAAPYHVCVVSAVVAEAVSALAPACADVFIRPLTVASPSASPLPASTPSATPNATPTVTPIATPTVTPMPTVSPSPVRTPGKGAIASPRPAVPYARAYVTVAFPSGVQELQIPYGALAPDPVAQIVAATSGRVTLQWAIDGLVVSTLDFNVVAGSITPVGYPGLLPVGGNHTLVAALVPTAYPLATPDPRAFVHYAYATPGGVATAEIASLPPGVGDHDVFFAQSDGHGRISLFWYPDVSHLTVPAFELTEVYAGKDRALLSSVSPGAAVATISTEFATARATGRTRELSQSLATDVFADYAFAQAAGFARSIVASDVGPRTYRVVELDASGLRTSIAIESNVVDPAVPSAGISGIAGLSATVSGHEVDLGWAPPSASDPPTTLAYDIVRAAGGVTLDLTPVPQLLGPMWTMPPQFVDRTAPAGTVATYTIRAVDVFGRRSDPATVSIWVPAYGADLSPVSRP